jgi:glycosyltransferase involved in cell wall biosynthesis
MITALSIIIPAYNEAQFLPKLLESLVQQQFAGELEVVVVDGSSTDDTVAIASSYKSRIGNLHVIEAERDIGHQRNIGAAQSHNPYLLFLDADVILPPGTLNAISVKVKSGKPFIATVFHVSEPMSLSTRAALCVLYTLMTIARLAKCPVMSGDFLLTTRQTHDQLAHGFAEGFLLGEDTDYGLRCVRAGARYHFYWTVSVIASDRRAREIGRLRLIMMWARAFIHVLRKGPVPKSSGLSYPFGHYGQTSSGGGLPGIGREDRI